MGNHDGLRLPSPCRQREIVRAHRKLVEGVPRYLYTSSFRQYLRYLNIIERINCHYCGYFNGIVAYTEEIAARTEQYWCPIKHARKVRSMHSRYRKFIDYGDGETYGEQIDTLRKEFSDLE